MNIEAELRRFRNLEFAREQQKKEYLRDHRHDRRRRAKPDLWVKAEKTLTSAKYLYATNFYSRCNFARIVASHFITQFDGTSEESFLVTLALKHYACPESDGPDFNVTPLRSFVRQTLRDCNFLGMVEVGLFSNLTLAAGTHEKTLSWHVHGLAWGFDEEVLRHRMKRISRQHPSLVPGINSAMAERIEPGTELTALLYSLKSPFQDYRIYPRKRQVIDPDTGEVTKKGTGRFTHNDGAMWPGDLVRIESALRNRYLDRLALATGEGVSLLKAIRHDALKAFHNAEAHRRSQRARP